MRIQKDYFNFIYSLAVKTVQEYFNSDSEISPENNLIKKKSLVNSRRMVYVLIKEGIPSASSLEIARIFKKNHATILYNLKKHKDLLEVDKVYKKDFQQVYAMFVVNNGIRDYELDRLNILTNQIWRLLEERKVLKKKLFDSGKIK
jgi:hypothetical protein